MGILVINGHAGLVYCTFQVFAGEMRAQEDNLSIYVQGGKILTYLVSLYA